MECVFSLQPFLWPFCTIFPGTPPVPLPSQGHFPMEISPLVGSSLERFSLAVVLLFWVISPEAGMDFSHYYERSFCCHLSVREVCLGWRFGQTFGTCQSSF